MASYQLDRRGSHYDDLRAGTIASLIANAHRDTKVRPEPFDSLHFMHWNELREEHQAQETPVLLDDPDAQSNLVLSVMFPNKGG